MRIESIATNLTCNQNCPYCTSRRPVDDPDLIRPASLRARMSRAAASGAKEILLTGGEPALRRDLAGVIVYARGLGLEVTLETNATLVNEGRAETWRRAGLGRARVNLAGGDDRLDAVTRDAGGFARTLAGIAALRKADVPVEIAAAVVRSTAALLPGVPAALRQLLGEDDGLEGIVLSVPESSPDPTELLSYDAAVETILAVDAAAQPLHIAVRVDALVSPPPCVFPSKAPSARLLHAMSPGGAQRPGYRRLAPCASCLVADRCAGVSETYLARFPIPVMRPITDERSRRRLSVISTVREQIARELESDNRRQKPARPPEEERIVRVNFQCNQACTFCFVSTHLPTARDKAIRAAIVNAGRRGARITISGGEPTLNPKLLEYIRLARQHSHGPVELQSNAIRFADMAFAQAVIGAGVDEMFVSLHGSTAEISDAVTEAPGTFVKTVAGLDNLARLDVVLGLNFVMCERNYRDLPEYIRFVHGRWPKALLSLSFVAPSSDVVPLDRGLIPRYSDVLPYLREALRIAQERGLWVSPLDSMCGLPLCLWPTALDEPLARADIPTGFDGGEFIKTEACRSCAAQAKCYGLRRRYAMLHGTEELRPVRVALAVQTQTSVLASGGAPR
jgi:MoaA/NifB/PqqE/SkfB family radical SAM enzyme